MMGFLRSAWVAAAVARLPRPLRILVGRLLRQHRPQHHWHFIGHSVDGVALWQCQRCLRIRRGPRPKGGHWHKGG